VLKSNDEIQCASYPKQRDFNQCVMKVLKERILHKPGNTSCYLPWFERFLQPSELPACPDEKTALQMNRYAYGIVTDIVLTVSF
jgi:hypothetical protein